MPWDTDISAGKRIASMNTRIIDWHDRPICAIERLTDGEHVLHCLIAWCFEEAYGIRLYFRVNEQFDTNVQTLIDGSWDSACDFIDEYCRGIDDKIPATIEYVPLEPVKVCWMRLSEANGLSCKFCDVDATMNNIDQSRWKEFIEAKSR